MEFIESRILLHCTGHLVPCEKAFKNRRLILFYFGSANSASCRQFLPKLKSIYQKSKEIRLSLEIIYVSFDEEQEMMTYFMQRHGGWFAVAPGDPAAWVLRLVFDVTLIPMVIVLGADGKVISLTGIQDIEELELNVLVAWNLLPPK